ncbi:JAB domain-containing protein [Chloroflexota bacterium]
MIVLYRVSVVFAHNHPSEDDIKVSARLAQAWDIMSITVLNYVIGCDENYLSLKSKGLF